MDLKKLFNECRDQLRADPPEWEEGDIHAIALEVILKDSGEFSEHYLDWIADMFNEKSQVSRNVGADMFSTGLSKMNTQLEQMKTPSARASELLMATFANSMANNFHSVAAPIYHAIVKGAEKHIEENAADWLNDMVAYYGDMEQAAREDYYDGIAAERRLEARDET